MGKKVEQHSESDNDYDSEEAEESLEESQEESGPTQEQINAKFGYKAIYEKDKILARLDEVEKNFYNRLESSRLIKKQGHIPFTEHMSISKFQPSKLNFNRSSQGWNCGARAAGCKG